MEFVCKLIWSSYVFFSDDDATIGDAYSTRSVFMVMPSSYDGDPKDTTPIATSSSLPRSNDDIGDSTHVAASLDIPSSNIRAIDDTASHKSLLVHVKTTKLSIEQAKHQNISNLLCYISKRSPSCGVSETTGLYPCPFCLKLCSSVLLNDHLKNCRALVDQPAGLATKKQYCSMWKSIAMLIIHVLQNVSFVPESVLASDGVDALLCMFVFLKTRNLSLLPDSLQRHWLIFLQSWELVELREELDKGCGGLKTTEWSDYLTNQHLDRLRDVQKQKVNFRNSKSLLLNNVISLAVLAMCRKMVQEEFSDALEIHTFLVKFCLLQSRHVWQNMKPGHDIYSNHPILRAIPTTVDQAAGCESPDQVPIDTQSHSEEPSHKKPSQLASDGTGVLDTQSHSEVPSHKKPHQLASDGTGVLDTQSHSEVPSHKKPHQLASDGTGVLDTQSHSEVPSHKKPHQLASDGTGVLDTQSHSMELNTQSQSEVLDTQNHNKSLNAQSHKALIAPNNSLDAASSKEPLVAMYCMSDGKGTPYLVFYSRQGDDRRQPLGRDNSPQPRSAFALTISTVGMCQTVMEHVKTMWCFHLKPVNVTMVTANSNIQDKQGGSDNQDNAKSRITSAPGVSHTGASIIDLTGKRLESEESFACHKEFVKSSQSTEIQEEPVVNRTRFVNPFS